MARLLVNVKNKVKTKQTQLPESEDDWIYCPAFVSNLLNHVQSIVINLV